MVSLCQMKITRKRRKNKKHCKILVFRFIDCDCCMHIRILYYAYDVNRLLAMYTHIYIRIQHLLLCFLQCLYTSFFSLSALSFSISLSLVGSVVRSFVGSLALVQCKTKYLRCRDGNVVSSYCGQKELFPALQPSNMYGIYEEARIHNNIMCMLSEREGERVSCSVQRDQEVSIQKRPCTIYQSNFLKQLFAFATTESVALAGFGQFVCVFVFVLVFGVTKQFECYRNECRMQQPTHTHCLSGIQ